MEYQGDGTCNCLNLRGDMAVHQVFQHGSFGNCTLCSNRSTSAADVPVNPGLLEAQYNLVLGSEPMDDVNVSVSPNGGELRVEPSWVLFSPSNWFIPQSVSVVAINDLAVERLEVVQVLHAVSRSEDLMYGSHKYDAPSVNVTVSDDDIAMVHLSTSRIELNETGQASTAYSVWERRSDEDPAARILFLRSLNEK